MSWRWFHQWGSPRWFYERAHRGQLVCGWLALILLSGWFPLGSRVRACRLPAGQ